MILTKINNYLMMKIMDTRQMTTIMIIRCVSQEAMTQIKKILTDTMPFSPN